MLRITWSIRDGEELVAHGTVNGALLLDFVRQIDPYTVSAAAGDGIERALLGYLPWTTTGGVSP